MKNGIISYGEAFIDYIANDPSNSNFQTYLGGTTVNVAVGVRRLGTPAYYLCKIGTDDDSQFITTKLNPEQVSQEFCVVNNHKSICKVYTHLNENRERYFHAYIDDTPDEQLLETELHEELFNKAMIFYCGSGTLFHPTAKNTTKAAIKMAKKHGTLVAFDPNIRLKRWQNEQECRGTINSILSNVDILKIAKDELLFLMETSTLEEGINKLADYQIPYVWITLGEKGALVIHQDKKIHVASEKVQAIDTTGAGDAFMAGILYCFHEYGTPTNQAKLTTYTKFANKLGAKVTTRFGALTAQ
ncbi:carbohydrate kinase family protein [Virgibacillus doumboii]|uniref:carbohydrate kinase family protein n=1 Tax=Virgibacillus doumboii TaxID=2697503 RepID=UPI0013E083BF|nr:carbohydrate kinase [Virgibacillus doumboii]